MVKYEFKPELIEGGFLDRLAGPDVTPEELAAYFNQSFDQSARQSLAAMADNHDFEIGLGGEVKIREWNGFEEWKERTGWEPPEGPPEEE